MFILSLRFLYTIYFFFTVFATYFFYSAIILPIYPFLGKRRYHAYRFFAKLWASTALLLTGLYPRKVGQIPHSKEARLFILNHQSQIDILIALAILPTGFSFVAKKELFKAPLLGISMKIAGYIPIERTNARRSNETLQRVQNLVKNGQSILIYPEGTRSINGKIGHIKRGSIMLAFQTGTPLVPVIINPAYKILPKNSLLLSYHRLRCIAGSEIIFNWANQTRDYTMKAAQQIEDTFKALIKEI